MPLISWKREKEQKVKIVIPRSLQSIPYHDDFFILFHVLLPWLLTVTLVVYSSKSTQGHLCEIWLDYLISLLKATRKISYLSQDKFLEHLLCDHRGPCDEASHHFSEFVPDIFPTLILQSTAFLKCFKLVKHISASGHLYFLVLVLGHLLHRITRFIARLFPFSIPMKPFLNNL